MSYSSSRSSTPSPGSPSIAPSAAPGQVVIAYYATSDFCSSAVGYITIPPSCAALDANSNSAFAALRGSNFAADETVDGQYYASSDLASGSTIGTKVWSSLAACQNRLGGMLSAEFGFAYSGIPTSCSTVSNSCMGATGNPYNCVGNFKCISGCLSSASPSATQPATRSVTASPNPVVLACGALPTSGLQAGNCSLFYSGSLISAIDAVVCAWLNCAANVSGNFYANYSCSCCSASLFRALPRTDLVGALVGNALNPSVGFAVGGSGPANEISCRQACCLAGPSCSAYAYTPYTNGEANCFLYDNVTGLVPSSLMSSAVLISKYS